MCGRVCTRTGRTCYLDERQRLLTAAHQCSFLLLLLLHDGGEGHQGGVGRAARCSQHPGPEGEMDDTETERDEAWVSVNSNKSQVLLTRSRCIKPCQLHDSVDHLKNLTRTRILVSTANK